MHTILNDIVGARKKAFDSGTAGSYGDDLLGQMLLAAASPTEKANGFNLKAVLDNAQLFFFAGQDTVANAIAYALLMLARHPDWQARARKEVHDVCGSRGTFHAGKLNNLKTVSNETCMVVT
jgi:cytokinin trans-hydroxylase